MKAIPIPSARSETTRPEAATFAPAWTMVIWTFAPRFMGGGVGTKQPRTLRLLVRADICCSESTSAITMAATNGLRNARGRWVVFNAGSSQIDERPDSSAGLVHDRNLCVKVGAAVAPQLPPTDGPMGAECRNSVNLVACAGPGILADLHEFAVTRTIHDSLSCSNLRFSLDGSFGAKSPR